MPSYRLILSDAFTALVELPPESIDALITDPPYSSGGLHAGDRMRDPVAKYEQSGLLTSRATFDGDSKDQRSWIRWCAEWLRLCYRAMKAGSPIAVFSDWRQLPALTDALQMADFVWRGIAVWDKTAGCRPQPGRPLNQCEYIVWGSKGRLPLNRHAPILPGVHQEFQRQSDKHHLTGKPLNVMRWLAALCTPGGLILDPFAGSGTTGVAALLDGHDFLGIERDVYYHGVADRRLAAAAKGEILAAQVARASRSAQQQELHRRRPRRAAAAPTKTRTTKRKAAG